MKPTILFLFNSSSYAVAPWLDSGQFNCVSVDYDDTDHSGAHRTTQDHTGHYRLNISLESELSPLWVNTALDKLGLDKPSFVLSFAPCTDLAVSGAAHFERKLKANPYCQELAVRMARRVEFWPCPSIVENPVSILATQWKKPTGYVHPWQFSYLLPHDDKHPEFPGIFPAGDWYSKKTGLWCQRGAVMPKVDREDMKGPTGPFPGHAQLGGKGARTKYIRSLTPRGMAQAIYNANSAVILRENKVGCASGNTETEVNR